MKTNKTYHQHTYMPLLVPRLLSVLQWFLSNFEWKPPQFQSSLETWEPTKSFNTLTKLVLSYTMWLSKEIHLLRFFQQIKLDFPGFEAEHFWLMEGCLWLCLQLHHVDILEKTQLSLCHTVPSCWPMLPNK